MTISTSFKSGRLTVFLAGELDHHEARETLRSLEGLLDEYLPRDCALDLSGLTVHRFERDGAWFDYIFANRRGPACHFFLVGIYCAQ